jgi:hypothetical protein
VVRFVRIPHLSIIVLYYGRFHGFFYVLHRNYPPMVENACSSLDVHFVFPSILWLSSYPSLCSLDDPLLIFILSKILWHPSSIWSQFIVLACKSPNNAGDEKKLSKYNLFNHCSCMCGCHGSSHKFPVFA